MRKELEEKLVRRFPTWFDLDANPMSSAMARGFECGDGWFDILWRLCVDLEPLVTALEKETGERFEVRQVKEKFGGLRFYINHHTEAIDERIGEARGESSRTCETCGQPGDEAGNAQMDSDRLRRACKAPGGAMKLMDMEKRRNRIRHILSVRAKRELRLTPGFQTHEALWAVAKKLPADFEPYGKRKRSDGEIDGDCSCNCRWFQVLAGMQGRDWGVCANPKSPRAGLLTFEHMGCPEYEWDKRADYLNTVTGKKAMMLYEEAEKELQAWRNRKGGLLSRLRKRRVLRGGQHGSQ